MTKTRKSVKESQAAGCGFSEKLRECDAAYTKGVFKHLRILVHFLGAAQFIYALYYWHVHVSIPVNDPKESWGGKLKFLTFLNLILQTVYHCIALLNDLLGTNSINPESVSKLRKLRDSIYTILALPIAFNVCVSFWVVYAFYRELIFPRELDPFFPNWLNHVVHTNIALLIIMDAFTCFREYPAGNSGVIATSLVMFLYIGWLHVTHYYNGRWAYPLFDVLILPLRYFMLFGIALVSIVFYFVGRYLNNVLWSQELKLLEQKKKLKVK